MAPTRSLVLIVPLLLAGCGSSAPSLSTSSLFGGKADAATPVAAPAPPPPATPEQRAAQVGATSARAVKCGYNFDPARLRASYLAAEAQGGLPADQLGKVEKAYDSINGQVAKAIGGQGDYCTDLKTREIKADLTRHLAGDYSPPPPKRVVEGPGFFDSIAGSSAESSKPFTAEDMWDRNNETKRRR